MLPEHICHVFIHTSLPVKHGILSALVISEYTLLQASEFRPNMLLQTSDLRPAVSTSSTPPLSPVPAFHSKPFFLCASKRGASIVANGSSLISTVALRLPQMRDQIQPKAPHISPHSKLDLTLASKLDLTLASIHAHRRVQRRQGPSPRGLSRCICIGLLIDSFQGQKTGQRPFRSACSQHRVTCSFPNQSRRFLFISLNNPSFSGPLSSSFSGPLSFKPIGSGASSGTSGGRVGLLASRAQEGNSPQNQSYGLDLNPDSLTSKSSDDKDALIVKLQVHYRLQSRVHIFLRLFFAIATEAC
jgi:hypothetical protein